MVDESITVANREDWDEYEEFREEMDEIVRSAALEDDTVAIVTVETGGYFTPQSAEE